MWATRAGPALVALPWMEQTVLEPFPEPTLARFRRVEHGFADPGLIQFWSWTAPSPLTKP